MAGLLSPGVKKALGGLLDPDNLARAAAFFQGDYDVAANITDNMQRRGLLAEKMQQEQAEKEAAEEQIRQRVGILTSQGVPEVEAYALASDDTAFRQIVGSQYEPQKPPAIGQNLDYYRERIQNDPQAKAAFKEYHDITNPFRGIGKDGIPFQLGGGGLPQGYDPNEWEVVPGPGGAGGNASGGFRGPNGL